MPYGAAAALGLHSCVALRDGSSIIHEHAVGLKRLTQRFYILNFEISTNFFG